LWFAARLIIPIAIQNSTANRKMMFQNCQNERGCSDLGIGSRMVSAWRFHLDERFNAKFGAALLAFNGEAVVYCRALPNKRLAFIKKPARRRVSVD
jgi:hypothetical protein